MATPTAVTEAEADNHDTALLAPLASLPSCFSMLDEPTLAHDCLALTRAHKCVANMGANVDPLLPLCNSAMESKQNRLAGLKALNLIASECLSEVFQAQAQSWFNKVSGYVKRERLPIEPKVLAQSCLLLGTMLKRAKMEETKVAPIAAKNLIKSLPSLISRLVACLNFNNDNNEIGIRVKKEVDLALLRLTETILRNFPGQCNNFKANLESSLWDRLSKPPMSPEGKTSLTRCAAQLFRMGGSGRGGESIKTRWSDLFKKTLDMVQKGMWKDLPTDMNLAEQASLGHHRLVSLIQLLGHLLLAPIPQEKKMNLSSVLKSFRNLFQPSVVDLLKKGEEDEKALLQAFYLPTILKAALGFLSTLIQVVKSNAMPFVPMLINEVFVLTLGGMPDSYSSNVVDRYEELKVALIQYLISLLTHLHPQQQLTTIVKLLMREITPVQTKCLTLVSKNNSNKGRTSKGVDSKSSENGATKSSKVKMRSTAQVIEHALSALKLCLDHNNLHSTHLNLFQDLQALLTALALQPLPPLKTSSKCRLRLFETLECLVVTAMSDTNTPSVLAMAAEVFERGQRDQCMEVKALCRRASLVCSAVSHPRAPGLNNFATPISLTEKMEELTRIHIIEVVRDSPFIVASQNLKRGQAAITNEGQEDNGKNEVAKKVKKSGYEEKDTEEPMDLDEDLQPNPSQSSNNESDIKENDEGGPALTKEKLMNVFYDQSITPIVIPDSAKEPRKADEVVPTHKASKDDDSKRNDAVGELSAENVLKLFDEN